MSTSGATLTAKQLFSYCWCDLIAGLLPLFASHYGSKHLNAVTWSFATMLVMILVLGLASQAGASTTCGGTKQVEQWSHVAYIFDGDTLRLGDGRIVRIIGMNAPELAHDGEPVQPLAQAAKKTLQHLLPTGSRVGLRYDQQRFGPHHRVLAHVFDKNGRNISAVMIRQGYAFAIAVAPNIWQTKCYFRQEMVARLSHRGIWASMYYRVRSAHTLRTHTGGFYRVAGRVTHIDRSRRNIWLDIGRHFAVRIPRKDMHYFSREPLLSLQGQEIIARGWTRYYNGRLNMTVTYPAMFEKQK